MAWHQKLHILEKSNPTQTLMGGVPSGRLFRSAFWWGSHNDKEVLRVSARSAGYYSTNKRLREFRFGVKLKSIVFMFSTVICWSGSHQRKLVGGRRGFACRYQNRANGNVDTGRATGR
jgi:hypothetical protein